MRALIAASLFIGACGSEPERPEPTAPETPEATPEDAAGTAATDAAAPDAEETVWPGSWSTRSPHSEVSEAYVLMEDENLGEARELIDAHIQESGGDADAFFVRGRVNMEAEAFDAAAADFRSSWGMDEAFHEARYYHAHSLVVQKRCEAALPLFDQLTEVWPERADLFYNRGHCHYYTSQFDKAIADSEKACELGQEEACHTTPKIKWRKQKVAEQEAEAAAKGEQPAPEAKPYSSAVDNTEVTGGPIAPDQ